MAIIITPEERELFKRCRRAWDLGSRHRQNYLPLPRVEGPDLGPALGRALDVYYFPGMWDWNRVIVRPLVFSALTDALHEQRASDAAVCGEEGDDAPWLAAEARGKRILEQYLDHAPHLDRFTPMRVATTVEVGIADRGRPGHDLVVEGQEVRFLGRVPTLVVDESDRYWLVDHHLAGSIGDEVELLKLDEKAASYCWAWERFFQGMRISGVVYNELLDVEAPAPAPRPAPGAAPPGDKAGDKAGEAFSTFGHRRMYLQSGDDASLEVTRESSGPIRRTWVPRSAGELANWGEQLALEAAEMTQAQIRVFPSPSLASCAQCAYRSPCIAMNEGTDVQAVLAASFRKRSAQEQLQESRSGGVRSGRGAAAPKFGLRPR